jgi:hypothetical protein
MIFYNVFHAWGYTKKTTGGNKSKKQRFVITTTIFLKLCLVFEITLQAANFERPSFLFTKIDYNRL